MKKKYILERKETLGCDRDYISEYKSFDEAKLGIHGQGSIESILEGDENGRRCWYLTTSHGTEYIITEFIPKVVMLNVEQTKKYRKAIKCPFCNSGDIQVILSKHSWDDGAMECDACKRKWREFEIVSLKIQEIY